MMGSRAIYKYNKDYSQSIFFSLNSAGELRGSSMNKMVAVKAMSSEKDIISCPRKNQQLGHKYPLHDITIPHTTTNT